MIALLVVAQLVLQDAPLDRLKPLVGHWKATTASGKALLVDYRFISNDSVLVESWAPGTSHETMTAFHADAASLVATHYCAQGNQPRLRQQADPKKLVFAFADATNLPDPDASHLVRLELSMGADGSLTRVETYREKGKDDVSTLVFRREGK